MLRIVSEVDQAVRAGYLWDSDRQRSVSGEAMDTVPENGSDRMPQA